ncbi:hypothetical protein chiPu_0006250 [Chiloscyllium punctatum]|uniref:L27-1 domain-containing protein n=1 Tax=Chiloscyllium punctatum TaxID=137246 RepID=A0A401SBT1_CHIPU|nr:hypothetical protein [Chiloscyllium punctatum]
MLFFVDTERAVQLLAKYGMNLPELEAEQLRVAIEKVTNILKSDLFQALLDIQEFYEVTLAAALKPTDHNLLASNLFSTEMGRKSTFTRIELLSLEGCIYNDDDDINHRPPNQIHSEDMPKLIQIKETSTVEVENICSYVSPIHTSCPEVSVTFSFKHVL